jgi:hypothetical protein
MAPVLLHGGSISGPASLLVVAGLAVFVLVLSFVFSSFQREEDTQPPSSASPRARKHRAE